MKLLVDAPTPPPLPREALAVLCLLSFLRAVGVEQEAS